ncbi:MAG TPA: hypothetical protein VK034_14535 [Enhygromyxa sp.]|nr:hypothetical protein [Enhygromyxa sp.]
MSEYLKPAIITASVSLEHGCTMLAETLERFIADYNFSFWGTEGNVLRLEYEGTEFRYEIPLDSEPPLEDIDRTYIEKIVAEHTGVAFSGDFRWPGLHRLLPVSIALCRTFDPERPVCLVVHMDAYLYNTLEDDEGRVNHEAADRFQKLAVTFGAHELTEGFVMDNIVSFGQVPVFDGEALKQSFLNPPSIREQWEHRGRGTFLPHGSVCGLKSSLLTREQLQALCPDAEVFETVTGMIIRSYVHLDDDDDD